MTDPGTVTAAEYDQLREGMTLEQVRALFGSAGEVRWASEYTSSASMALRWKGAVSIKSWLGWTDESSIDATFSMDKATTTTTYKRKKVKVKNVKRAKRLGLPRWKWKTIKVVTPVPATPYTVEYFSLDGAEILRQIKTLGCFSY